MAGEINRRTFTKSAAAAGALAALEAASFSAVADSNERIRLGFIGVGNRGDQLLDAFLPHKDAEVVALCDVYQPYLQAALKKVGGRARTYTDFRKLLERKDVDAVVIATPDHWHALQFVAACRAGKDVYVEKPLSLTIGEGRKMADVASQTKRVTQVGLHRRSSKVIHDAVRLIRDGAIGKVTVARCYHLRNEFPQGIGRPADCDPPAGLDWDFWLGPAPKVPYNPNRCLYKFRWFWDYSGGQLTNFGTHYLDVIQWALGQDAPKGCFAVGGKYAVEDNRDIPDTMEAVWEYDGTLVTFSQFNASASAGNVRGWEVEFRGTKGTLLMQEGQGYEIIPERNRLKELPALSPVARKENAEQARAVKAARAAAAAKGRADTTDHARNFLDCVKSRQPTNCPVEVGHRSTSATLLARMALKRGRHLAWDAREERVTNDEEANKLLSYEYRAPWKLA
ncbi:MAG TPA: Gfo/Idh/MocA family oxidoreductase [Gemmataceae bacterium]|nr:Gfo/Idh/MocA family oxidoreductase [Gemmataceae bacterium]